MYICPKCKSEYYDGHKICVDCNKELIKKSDIKKVSQKKLDDSLVFLKNVSDDYEKDLIVSFLESEDINVIEKYKGIGQYLKIYSGKNYMGIDLYVLKNDYEKAKLLINSLDLDSKTSNEDYEFEYNAKLKKRKKLFRWFIILTFIIPFIIATIFNLLGYL